MKLIKRNGSEAIFTRAKIAAAIAKANDAVEEYERITDSEIDAIALRVEEQCAKLHRSVSVEEVQDLVETELMAKGAYVLAKAYITYRYKRALVRRAFSSS